MAVTIRTGSVADLEVVQSLNAGLYEYENSLGFYDDSYDLTWTYSEAGTRYFTARLDDADAAGVVLIASDDDPVGYLAASHSSPTYRSQTPIAEVENMFVTEEMRGQGVGAALVEAFKQWAHSAGVARIRVGAFSGNSSALGFYRSCGFHDHELMLEGRI